MSTLDELRGGLARTWGHIAEGWHELRERAGQALTRFGPTRETGADTPEGRLVLSSSRWGMLPVEVRENDDSVEVRLEAPGMDPDGFDIRVVEGYLVVAGEKHAEREGSHGRFYVTERAYGRFERAVPLPAEVEEARASATYRQGVLRVRLPKAASARARRIRIEA